MLICRNKNKQKSKWDGSAGKGVAAKSAALSSIPKPTGLQKDSHKSSDMHRMSYQFMKNIQS